MKGGILKKIFKKTIFFHGKDGKRRKKKKFEIAREKISLSY